MSLGLFFFFLISIPVLFFFSSPFFMFSFPLHINIKRQQFTWYLGVWEGWEKGKEGKKKKKLSEVKVFSFLPSFYYNSFLSSLSSIITSNISEIIQLRKSKIFTNNIWYPKMGSSPPSVRRSKTIMPETGVVTTTFHLILLTISHSIKTDTLFGLAL